MESYRFSRALERVIGVLYIANKYWDSQTPWKLAKSTLEQDKVQLHNTLYLIYETVRICGILLTPVMPESMGRLLDGVGIESGERGWDNARVGKRWRGVDEQSKSVTIQKMEPLFPKIK
jgi:methionyl-tRNA synthetase